MRPLNILHVLRAPVGGLFRHVVDLAEGQARRGHQVGLVADMTTGAARAEARLAALAPLLVHGIVRVPMSRHIGVSDFAAHRAVAAQARRQGIDVVHGHGAKGGAYARLLRQEGAIRVYTPHGGSLHYRRASPLGMLYLSLERILMARSELLLFESAYGRDVFRARVGAPACRVEVVHNGVSDSEFAPLAPDEDASDVVFVGELRTLKGVDVLIDALALLARQGSPLSATIVGEGPDGESFKARAQAAGLDQRVTFPGAMPARAAFARGRVLVVPSRAESLPYIVLEAGAAGIPQVVSAVGGIGEIFGPQSDRLVPPGDAAALARGIHAALADSAEAERQARQLQQRLRGAFSVEAMTDQVLAAYRKTIGEDA